MLPFIIGAILLLLIIICLIPVGIRIKYEDDFSLYAVFSFIRIRLIPKRQKVRISDYSVKKMQREEEKRKRKLEKQEKKGAKTEKKESADNVLTASLKDPERRLDMIRQLYDIITVVLDEFAAILTVKFFRLHVVIGAPEPSTTAILYGGACAAAGRLVNLISQYTDIEKNEKNSVYIIPDFASDKTTASADVSITLSIGGIFVFLFRIRKVIKKILELLQEDKKNG